jgi:glucokinase
VGDVALAVDIGGTKLGAGLVDRTGAILDKATVATPRTDSAEWLFGVLATLVTPFVVRGPVVCGVGCGGPMTPGGAEVSPLNIPAWRGFPLASRLASLTGLAVFVDNDAKALALGEGWVGAAVGCIDYLAMVVSTGIGGGIVLDGRLLDGASGNAGHVGHLIVVPDGRRCACGARGCLEAEASGSALQAWTGRPAAQASAPVIERSGRLVGRAAASVAHLLDLRLAVVAGSVALGFGAPFFAAAQDEVDECARLSFAVGTRIVPAGLGEAGPLVGAAAVGWRGLRRPEPLGPATPHSGP